MIRLVFLIMAILLIVFLFWIISFLPQKKINLDLFCLVNTFLYLVLLASIYIFLAEEVLGLFGMVAIFGTVSLRRYLSGRWI